MLLRISEVAERLAISTKSVIDRASCRDLLIVRKDGLFISSESLLELSASQRGLKTLVDPTPDQIQQRCEEVHQIRAVLAIEFEATERRDDERLIIALKTGPRSSAHLAKSTGVSLFRCRRLLNSMVARGSIEEIGQNTRKLYRLKGLTSLVESADSILDRFKRHSEAHVRRRRDVVLAA